MDDILHTKAPDAGAARPAAAVKAAQLLFGAAARAVPAFSEFVAEQQGAGQANDRRGGADDPLSAVPYTTKANYFRAYPLARRCWGGALAGADFVHFSSGSSGEPTPWARCADDEAEVAARFEQVLRDSFSCHERSSLCIVALPLGSWVGGVFTTMCLRLLSLKGYRLVVTTPGNKPAEILQVAELLGPSCNQTIILGYPPFVKGVVDEGLARGVDWGRHNLKLVLAGEVFSEEWRALVARRARIAEPHRAVVSIYGTADAGVIAQETPLSALARRWLSEHPEAARELFGRDRLPTLAQYDPCNRFLELHPDDGTIVVTALPGPGRAQQLERAAAGAGAGAGETAGGGALRGAPLIRYCIGDAGGVAGFDDVIAFLRARGLDPLADERSAPVQRQPFVWVFGRSFWAVSLYGANVYVEQVMPALEGPDDHAAAGAGGSSSAAGGSSSAAGGSSSAAGGSSSAAGGSSSLAGGGGGGGDGGGGDDSGGGRLSDLLTGKFVLYVEEDADSNPRLALRVETARGAPSEGAAGAALAARVAAAVLRALLRASSEYASYVPAERQLPIVRLHAHGDPEWFPVGVKHKYTLG